MRRIVVLSLLVACSKEAKQEPASVEPSEAEVVARAVGLEREGKLAEARATLPEDCDEDECFEARVRIGKALAAELEQGGLDDAGRVGLYLDASIDASDRSWPVCAFLDVIGRLVEPTRKHPVLVSVLEERIAALRFHLPAVGETEGIRLAYVAGVDAGTGATSCDGVGDRLMAVEGQMRALTGGNDGNSDRRSDAFAYGFLRTRLDEALAPPPPPPEPSPAKPKGKGKGKAR